MTAATLAALESAGLVKLIETLPEPEYSFRHALIQDAAYQSLLKSDRKALHQAVGEALEMMHAGRLEELAPLLGTHFYESGDAARAFKYFMQAGDSASRVYANSEAGLHFSRALDLSDRVQLSDEEIIMLISKYGTTLELVGEYRQALALYQGLEDRGRASGVRRMELSALLNSAKVYATPNPAHDPDQALALLRRALELARSLGDRAAEAQILWNLMVLLVYGGGDQRQAISYGRHALSLARQLNLQERIAFTLNDLTYAYIATDQWEDARAAQQEACQLWRQRGNLPMLADNLANSVLVHFHDGEYGRALLAAEEALEISESIDNLWGQTGSNVYRGLIYWERGEISRAIAIMEAALRLGEQSGHPAALIGTRADLAWVYGSAGKVEHGLALAEKACDEAIRSGLAYLGIWPKSVLARLKLLQGDQDGAEELLRVANKELNPEILRWFASIFLPLTEVELDCSRKDYQHAIMAIERLIGYLEGIQMRPFFSEAVGLKGKILLELGELEPARLALLQARSAAQALGSLRCLWPADAALGELERRAGNHTSASQFQAQARDVLGVIVARLQTNDLQTAFLRLPEVEAVMQP
jgi:tetratricopeptide (TPR) repeat protein